MPHKVLKASIAVLSLMACIFFYTISARTDTQAFEVPAGKASYTLILFAKQSGVEIIFTSESVRGIRTNAIEGNITPHEALQRMVAGTPLDLDKDSETGTYAIIRLSEKKSESNADHSTQTRRPLTYIGCNIY